MNGIVSSRRDVNDCSALSGNLLHIYGLYAIHELAFQWSSAIGLASSPTQKL